MKTLVVARYNEDVSWYEHVPSDWKIMEVQKGREVPNTGREVSSFLWAITQLYDELREDDLVAFVQGDPFDGCPDIDLFILLDTERPSDGYFPLGDFTYVSGGDGAPQHVGLPVYEGYCRYLERPWPGAVSFAPGGQFRVAGRDILQRDKAEYHWLMDRASEDKDAPWVIERLWPTIFAPLHATDLKATFYCQATPVTTYLRCSLPARYLPGKVLRECVYAQDDEDYWFPLHEGAAVFQFAGDAFWAAMVHGLQDKGHRVLMEADDNYFQVAPQMKRTGWDKTIKGATKGHSLEGHAKILEWVDGCIVTTEHLAKQYRKRNPNVFVCPNTVDPIDWPQRAKIDDGILRIGWFASNSHVDDGNLVRRALEWASRQPNVEVLSMGFHPDWRFPHRHIEWQDLQAYRQALFALDIGVAPIVGTPWALCRSDLKALEYTMGGAALVLSDVAPYSLFTHDENCLKAKTPADFLRCIQYLVQSRDVIKQLAAAGRDYVLTKRTTEAQIHLWREAIEGD
jgi:hypothetical protein